MNTPLEKTKNVVGFWSYVIAVVGAFLIVGALVWITRSYTEPAPLGNERAQERAKYLAEIRANNDEVLNNYAWQDQTKGLVRLPIDQAMHIVLENYGKDRKAGRADLIAREEKATFEPPKPPAKPSQFE